MKRWWAWSVEQETRFAHQSEEASSFDMFKYEATTDYKVRNDFGDIRSKAFKIRRKIYEQDIKQKETHNIQLNCNDNLVQTLKPAMIEAANKSIDDKTKNFSKLSKRIQKDRQHCNNGGYFENHIKSDAKDNKTVTLYASFKKFLKNFKAHRYKEFFLDGNATKENKTTNSLFPAKYSLFCFRKRRKKKGYTDYLEIKTTAISILDSPEINIERKINSIDICNSEYGTDTKRLSEDFYNERCYSDKAIRNWNKLEDGNTREDKTTVNYYGYNRSTDLTYNITYYTGLTVDKNKNNTDIDEKKNCNKENCRRSSFNTSLCYYFQNFIHHFGSRNKIASNSDRLHHTYMIMNFEKSEFKPDYNMKPTTFCGLSSKKTKPYLKEIENLRKHRLSSYLAERDWMVKRNGYKNYLRKSLQKLLSISECEISGPSVVRFHIFLTGFI